jgi:hypothetical protein
VIDRRPQSNLEQVACAVWTDTRASGGDFLAAQVQRAEAAEATMFRPWASVADDEL